MRVRPFCPALSFLSLAALLAGCATYQTDPPPPLADVKFVAPAAAGASAPQAGDTPLTLAERTFASAIWTSASDADEHTKALKAYSAGIAMLTLQCDSYLTNLGAANQRASNERKQVNLAGGFASAIMGLTGAAAKAIAGTATTFSFATSSMDASSTTFLFADAAKSIGDLVRTAQSAYIVAAAERTADGIDYSSAVVLLTGYSQLCQPSKIRALVDEAISTAKIVAEIPGQESASAEVLTLLGKLTDLLKRRVEEPDAIALYAWFTGTATERDNVKGKSDFVKNQLNPPGTSASLSNLLTPVFAPLSLKGDPVAVRWSAPATAYKSGPVGAPPPASMLSQSPRVTVSAPAVRIAR